MATATAIPHPALSQLVQQVGSELELEKIRPLWEQYSKTDFPGRKTGTMIRNMRYLKVIFKWMEDSGHRCLTVDALQEYCTFLFDRYGRYGAIELWKGLCRFLRWMERTGKIPFSPHRAIRLPKVNYTSSIAPMSSDEYAKLRAAAAGHWMDWVIMLGWHTGMSMVDCMGLKWRNVDLKNCVITIRRSKTNAESIIPFDPSDELGRGLASRRDSNPDATPDDWVCEEAGSRLNQDSPYIALAGSQRFMYIRKRAGLEGDGCKFHSMRHRFVSRLANSGASTALGSKITGHSNPSIFARYVHADRDALRKVVEHAKINNNMTEEVYVDPHPKPVKDGKNYEFRPNRVYQVKRGKVKLPDGVPLEYVKTGANASGKQAVVTPCDMHGETTAELNLIVHFRDVRSFR